MSILGMNIGGGEILLILLVALIVVGPEKLPSYARKIVRVVRQFQKVTTNLTGEITKAINLDEEEDGKSSDFRKDLIAVKKSLEKEVAELKTTLDVQAKAISETVEAGTKDAAAQLKKNAGEISDALNTQAGEIKTTLNAQAQTVSQTVEAGVKGASAQLEQGAREVSAAAAVSSTTAHPKLQNQNSPEPVSSPSPFPAASEAEVN